MGGMALASDGPTDVKDWLKLEQQIGYVVCGREEAPGTVFWIIGMELELSAEFLPITLLIVFQVSLGVLEFSNSWVL